MAFQLTLGLFGSKPLFEGRYLERYLSSRRKEPVAGLEDASSTMLKIVRQTKAKEGELEQSFNHAFFGRFLGYRLYPSDRWSAWPKPPTSRTGLTKEPDVLLGDFTNDLFWCVAVVELKRPGTSLDAPQKTYDNKSPVEQAIEYASHLSGCQWVIVSDMAILRLYHVDSMESCHEIDLRMVARETNRLRDICFLLSYESLISNGDDAPVSRLLRASRDRQREIRDDFYRVYSEIRTDILEEIERATKAILPALTREEKVLSAQRLLDRILFIHFCEDHPERLLPANLLHRIVDNAVRSPGPEKDKAYRSIKKLFRDLDTGQETKFWKVPGYNGELFKFHNVVDRIDLPDDLHSKRYPLDKRKADDTRTYVEGAWGLHIFDFWRELDRDLLGHIFEQSIGDLQALATGARPNARAELGIFFTASRLAKFVSQSTLFAALSENDALQTALTSASVAKKESEFEAALKDVLKAVKKIKIVDIACGSGVFLTAALEELLSPYRKALESAESGVGGLARRMFATHQSEVLGTCIRGVDVLPAAVELAKLALWLTAARQNEKSTDLQENFVVGDALSQTTVDAIGGNANFDIVIGNPPWGGNYDEGRATKLLEAAGVDTNQRWDTWELFLIIAVRLLKEGGRFGLLVPDTYPLAEKKKIREFLHNMVDIEKFYMLGSDWFGPQVRMGTVFIQGRRLS